MLDPARVGWKVITTSTGLLMLVYHIGIGLSQQKFCRLRVRNIGQGPVDRGQIGYWVYGYSLAGLTSCQSPAFQVTAS